MTPDLCADDAPLQTVNSDVERYKLLVDAITDYAIYMLDPDGIITSWNMGAQRFKGYRADEILGEHFSRFYTEEDLATGLPARALSVAASEGRFENEGWRVRKDGSRFWAHVIIDPIKDPDGHLLGFAKITRDLTERKIAQEALKRSEEQFRILVQGVTDYAIYMLDPEGHVTNWNPGAERIKGYSPDEIVGQHFSRFYTDEDREQDEPERALETAAREGRFEREALRRRKDGSRFWAHVVIDAIRDEEGKLIGFAKITRDVTERKEAQRELEEAREALFQSQKTEAIGQLTGGVAHDFNNLLMAVLGSLELLRKRLPKEDPGALRLLENAVQGAQRGAALTQRMLAFARRQELDLGPVDVPDLVRGMADLLQRSLGPEILIETRFPLSLPMVHGDANHLETALLNLAVNARDAMNEAGRLVIGAREEAVQHGHDGLKPGAYVCLYVTDEGDGMDEETLSRALDPFFTTKGVGKGTGLGLSMVHGLARQSGGRLVLRSREGEGTTAEIWLPQAEPMVEDPDRQESAPDVITPHVTGLRVLAVDDDALVLMNTGAMLEDLGHTVFEAASGREALDILSREREIDLVISDQAMPHMTGTQLAQTIRAERPDLPIILATGYAELPPGTGTELPRLSKPFFQHDLVRAIAAALRG